MIRRSGLTRTSVFSQKMPDDVTDDQSLETLPPSFDIMKKGKPFSLERPQFKKGTPSAIVDESISTFNIARLNKRSGLGNNTILRDSFRTPDVLGRQLTDYALAELIDRQQQGIKVQLSDKTLKDLFQVKTVDPDDKEWLAEYNRRLAGGETKEQLKAFPPFGREQRVMFKTVNFGEGVSLSETSSKTVTEQLTLLKEAVTAGSGTTDLTEVLAKIFELTEKVDAFSVDNYGILGEILNKIGVINPDPRIYFGAGYHRLWDKDQFLANQAKVVVFLLANQPTKGMESTPVRGETKLLATLQAMYTSMAKGTPNKVFNASGTEAPYPQYTAYQWYLDIDRKRLISRADAVMLVSGSENVDNGQLGGLNPPPLDDGSVGTWM